MKDLLLIIVPLAGAAVAALWPDNRSRPWLLPAVGGIHCVLSVWLLIAPPEVAPRETAQFFFRVSFSGWVTGFTPLQ